MLLLGGDVTYNGLSSFGGRAHKLTVPLLHVDTIFKRMTCWCGGGCMGQYVHKRSCTIMELTLFQVTSGQAEAVKQPTGQGQTCCLWPLRKSIPSMPSLWWLGLAWRTSMHGTHALTVPSTARQCQRDTLQLRHDLTVRFATHLCEQWIDAYAAVACICSVENT